MVYPSKLISLFICLLSTHLYAGELETQLQKLGAYKQFSSTIDNDAQAKKGTAEFQKFLEQKKTTPQTANEEAKLVYENNVDAKPCTHCPKYLNLTMAVNDIVEKVQKEDKTSSVSDSNEQMLQLNKLKFLYYVVRTENNEGEISCQKFGDRNYFKPTKLEGNFKMLSDTMIKMSNVTDIQYLPRGQDEVYYYYRGEGDKSNILIEVVMNKDVTARIRYYDMLNPDGTSSNRLPVLGTLASKDMKPAQKDEYFDVGLDIKTRNTVLHNDIGLSKEATSLKVMYDVNLKLKNENSFNQQSAGVDIVDDTGTKWVSIQGKNVVSGAKSLTTIIPVEISLDKSSELKMSGSLQNDLTAQSLDQVKKLDFTANQTVQFGLTDHNNEYVNVKATADKDGFSGYSVSNKFALTEGSSVGAAYEQTRDGKKSFSINNVANFNEYGTLTTSFGTDSSSNRYVQTQYEKKIGSTSTIAIGAKTTNTEKTFMLTYQTKF